MATRSLFRSSGNSPSLWLWLGLALVVVLLDQYAKTLFVGDFQPGESRDVTSSFDVVRRGDTGMAWSLLANAGGWQRWFFVGLAPAHGAGVHFISPHWRHEYAFPAFDLADSAITLGAICLILDELRRVRKG